jgi:hypothetical protein
MVVPRVEIGVVLDPQALGGWSKELRAGKGNVASRS